MKKRILIGIAVIFIVGMILYIQKSWINPTSVNNLEARIKQRFIEVIVYKNSHRGLHLYLNKYNNSDNFKNINENEAFKKPNKDSVNYIINTKLALYDLAEIGDKIEKLPNSNKCYLYKTDSIFKLNLYDITESERKEMKTIDEWSIDEIGYVSKKWMCKQKVLLYF